MKANQELLKHPYWSASDPAKCRLVRVSGELPAELNPFVSDNVIIRAAGVPGETPHSKWVMAREGILDGIRKGRITPDTKVIEATSGNTGDGMSAVCNALGLNFTAVMSGDVPHDKIDVIRVMGRHSKLHLLLDPDETTVEYARRLGAQDGWYNPDQYAGSWNYKAHYEHLAPQLWKQAEKISILVAPNGTMGTSIAFKLYAQDNGFDTRVVPVLCAEEEEVPAARTLSGVKKDVRQPWEELFKEEDFAFGTRHAAFFLSFLTWPYLTQHLGPTFGLALAGAFSFLKKHRDAGTLDQFRLGDGKIQVVVFGPDSCHLYKALYFGELKKWELSAKVPPKNLLLVLER